MFITFSRDFPDLLSVFSNSYTVNNNEKFRSFKSKENIHKKEVGPYRGFGYIISYKCLIEFRLFNAFIKGTTNTTVHYSAVAGLVVSSVGLRSER